MWSGHLKSALWPFWLSIFLEIKGLEHKEQWEWVKTYLITSGKHCENTDSHNDTNPLLHSWVIYRYPVWAPLDTCRCSSDSPVFPMFSILSLVYCICETMKLPDAIVTRLKWYYDFPTKWHTIIYPHRGQCLSGHYFLQTDWRCGTCSIAPELLDFGLQIHEGCFSSILTFCELH